MRDKPISNTTTTNNLDGDMVKVKCHLCGYEWNTESVKVMVTCPSCMRKTAVKKGEKK